MTQMEFDFSTKEGRLNAAKEFTTEFKKHLTEEEAAMVSYNDGEHILTNGAASSKDLEMFITAILSDMPKLIALILLRRVLQRLMESVTED